MISKPSQRRVWLSYYTSIDHNVGVFLSAYLAPLVQEETSARRLKRFFFIRYTEETLQLRMRFLPNRPEWATQIDSRILGVIEEFNSRFAVQRRALVKQVPYDRSLYFGETMRSVYSELLNEHTSHLALRLLQLYSQQRAKLFVVLTSVLHHVLSRILTPGKTLSTLAGESLEFARKAIADLEFLPIAVDSARASALSGSLLSISGTAHRTLQGDHHICTLVRLLQRVQKLHGGDFVRIHSLHLIANKLGFSLADECTIFTLLKEMTCHTLAMRGMKHDQMEQLSHLLHEHQ